MTGYLSDAPARTQITRTRARADWRPRRGLPPGLREPLRQARSEARLSQRQLAALLGVAQSTVARIEAGERRPSRQLAALLVEALSLPPWLGRRLSESAEVDGIVPVVRRALGRQLRRVELRERRRRSRRERMDGLRRQRGGRPERRRRLGLPQRWRGGLP